MNENVFISEGYPAKSGWILNLDGGETPWQTNDWREVPVCSTCNQPMAQGIRMIDREYKGETWFCMSKYCRHERARNYKLVLGITVDYLRYGIPEHYRHCDMTTYRGTEAQAQKIHSFIGKTDRNLLLVGPCGSGKTHLAIAILIELAKRHHHSMLFKSVPSLFLELTSAIKDPEQDYTHLIRKYIQYEILVLDDLGAEKTSDHVISTLYTLLNERLIQNKVTIVTTNLDSKEMRAKFSDRIASRLSEYEQITHKMSDKRGNE